MVGDCCKPCDGRGFRIRKDPEGFGETQNTCSKCGGTGKVNPPSSGRRRPFKEEEKDESELSLEEQTRAFLRKNGY